MRFVAVARPEDEAVRVANDSKELFETMRKRGGDCLDLDKAWHGMHWLLTRTAYDTSSTLGQALLGGSAVGVDFGYGAARMLSPDVVQSIDAALESVDVTAATSSYDPQAMDAAGVYPAIWTREGAEGLRWLLNYLPAFKAFYRNAAASRFAVVLLLT